METLVYTQSEIGVVATKLIQFASKGNTAIDSTIIALSGNLGAGKTTLIQELATIMGVTEQVTSPTFVVMKRYQTTHCIFSELIHIDAYRIEQAGEMQVLGFMQWIKNPQTLICIEWPEKISSLIPSSAISASITGVDENTRKITYG